MLNSLNETLNKYWKIDKRNTGKVWEKKFVSQKMWKPSVFYHLILINAPS